jgi:hypothetical protein
MSELGDEIAALRASLAELRVDVARRWATGRGEPLPAALERSVRRAGLRVLAGARATHGPSSGRQRQRNRSGAAEALRHPTASRAGARQPATRWRRAAGAVLLVAALLWPLLGWLPIGAPIPGAKLLLGLAAACGGALGLRLLRKG